MTNNYFDRKYRLQFAYDAVMNKDYINHYCSNPQAVAVACIEGYEIGFFGASGKWDGALATAIESPGKTLWGVVYKLSFSDSDKLDDAQDVRWNGTGDYFLYPVNVADASGNRYWTMIYKKDILAGPQLPSSGLLDCIVQGARFRGLPQPYISDLMRTPVKQTSYAVPKFGKFDGLSTYCRSCDSE